MSNESRYIELINREIDGVNTAEESRELVEILRSNPEAQRLYHDLKAMATMLSEVRESASVPHPENLKRNIMRAILAHRLRPSRWEAFLAFVNHIKYRFNYRYAYAFSLGLLSGIVLLSLSWRALHKDSSLDISQLYGTISSNRIPEGFQEGEQIHINQSSVKGTMRLFSSGAMTALEVTLSSSQNVEMDVGFDEGDLTLGGFFQEDTDGCHLTAKASSLRIDHHHENEYLIFFYRVSEMARTPQRTPSLDVLIRRSDEVIFRCSIPCEQMVDQEGR